MSDAKFEDGREAPLNLGAEDAEDLAVLSALAQDAVFGTPDMKWEKGARRFSILLNRFRWEDGGADRHGPERVRSVLTLETVQSVASQGVDRSDPDLVLSLLSLTFEPDEEAPGGAVLLTLAGDGAIRIRVEAPQARLRDVTRPYGAVSGHRPTHD
ncbi:DUF2948 family protein [Pseudooceanicola onchidii]|uniref:DUF2948 family protein n=1 Tax=Pseudooceanicola onchidii TaxID=2562279 RepID=UPI0010AA595F|nr:DUF2948 family protein [Pseudooceanicola onchidii]